MSPSNTLTGLLTNIHFTNKKKQNKCTSTAYTKVSIISYRDGSQKWRTLLSDSL